MQTNLQSDAFCIYNQESAPLEWVLQKGQYNNTFAYGTIGVNATSNAVRPDVINIDSFLSGRDDILSKCNPPIPALDESNVAPLTYQNQQSINDLQPIYSREKRSAIDLDSITYLPLTMNPELPVPPQDLNHIVFGGWAQRGGADTRGIVKSAWTEDMCNTFLDPQYACGAHCAEANGYMVRSPATRNSPEAEWGALPRGLPRSAWYLPNQTQVPKSRPRDITSDFAVAVGASSGGVDQYVVPAPSNRPLPNIGNPSSRFKPTMDAQTGVMYPNSKLYNLMAH